MAKGFLNGVLIGAVVSVGAAAGLSLVSGGPVMKEGGTPVATPGQPAPSEAETAKAETPVPQASEPLQEQTAETSQEADNTPENSAPEEAPKETAPAPEAPVVAVPTEAPAAPAVPEAAPETELAVGQESGVEPAPKPEEVATLAPEKPAEVVDVPAKAPEVQSSAPATPQAPKPAEAEPEALESAAAGPAGAAVLAEQPQKPVTEAGIETAPEVGAPAVKAEPEAAPETEPEQEVALAEPKPAEPEPAMPAEAEAEPEARPAAKPGVVSLGQGDTDGTIRVGRPASGFKTLGQGVQTGRLPTIAAAGGEAASEGADASALPPVERYAEPFEGDENKAKMAIVLIDEGDPDVGIEALSTFPYPLSIAVDTSREDATEKMEKYRAAGLEVLAMVRLPEGATPEDVEVNLPVLMAKVPEAVAVMEAPGDGIQFDRRASDQVARILGTTGHGLLLFPKGLNTAQKLAAKNGVPSATVFRDIDGKGQNAGAIRRFLNYGALNAANEGGVVEVARLHPDTVSALLVWALDDRAGQVALAPVSHLLQVQ